MKSLTFSGRAAGPETRSKAWLRCLQIVGRSHGFNMTTAQLIKDNLLDGEDVTLDEMIRCAQQAGLKARSIRLDFDELKQLKKALPTVVRLKTGGAMVLTDVNAMGEVPFVRLTDPDADEGAELVIDRVRLEEIWTGELVLIRREYKLLDEEKPFGWPLIFALFLRERRMLRDVAIGSFALSALAIVPMIAWRLLAGTVLTYRAYNTFTVICVAVASLFVLEGVLTFMRNYLIQIITARVDTRMMELIFDRLLNMRIDFFERTQIGQISHDIQESQKIRRFINESGFVTILDSLTLLIVLPIMFAFSALLTFIVLGLTLLMGLFLILMLPAIRRATGEVIVAEVNKNSFLYQNLAGIRTVKSLALESRQRAIWDVLTVRVSDALFHMGYISGIVQAVMKPMSQLSGTGALAVGVYVGMSTNNPVAVGDIYAFMILIGRAQAPLMGLANLITQYDEARAAVAIVGKLMSQPTEEGRAGHGVRTPLEGNVEFSNVRFKYAGSLSYALDGVSFEAPKGWTLGVVGRSGSGKTTVTRLLQRLHSDYEGLIKIDGVDVREYDVAHLRRSLGVVLQENFLFSGTIRENITAAKPHATFDDMVRAARLAGAEEFIDRLPRGYETHIYEGSPNLSGGQRQRLAIARALILDPKILILDEATSALDPDSEAIVNENIRRIAMGRTVIVISHRLSSLVASDAILVLERGKFEAIGTHASLLEDCEIYRNLWQQQNRHVNAAAAAAAAAAQDARAITRGPSRVS
jgi:subfamily B ATP-binding cassette protein HlyB/CyaB